MTFIYGIYLIQSKHKYLLLLYSKTSNIKNIYYDEAKHDKKTFLNQFTYPINKVQKFCHTGEINYSLFFIRMPALCFIY